VRKGGRNWGVTEEGVKRTDTGQSPTKNKKLKVGKTRLEMEKKSRGWVIVRKELKGTSRGKKLEKKKFKKGCNKVTSE